MKERWDGGRAFPRTTHLGPGSTDPDQHGMSLRQYAAIKLRVPDSGTDWLDEMIRRARCDEFAAAALTGLLADEHHTKDSDGYHQSMAKAAYRHAESMLVEGEHHK